MKSPAGALSAIESEWEPAPTCSPFRFPSPPAQTASDEPNGGLLDPTWHDPRTAPPAIPPPGPLYPPGPPTERSLHGPFVWQPPDKRVPGSPGTVACSPEALIRPAGRPGIRAYGPFLKSRPVPPGAWVFPPLVQGRDAVLRSSSVHPPEGSGQLEMEVAPSAGVVTSWVGGACVWFGAWTCERAPREGVPGASLRWAS
jgi:hypothetical protein